VRKMGLAFCLLFGNEKVGNNNFLQSTIPQINQTRHTIFLLSLFLSMTRFSPKVARRTAPPRHAGTILMDERKLKKPCLSVGGRLGLF